MPKNTKRKKKLPHKEAVHRVQESFEDFKEKANPAFEEEVKRIAATGQNKFARFIRSPQGWITSGALSLALLWLIRPRS